MVAEGAKMMGKDEVYDLMIIGSGPAGLSVGINAATSGLKTLILETEEFGGKAAGTSLYENYPGAHGRTTNIVNARHIVQRLSYFLF